MLFRMWGYLLKITHQGHSIEGSLEDSQQNSYVTWDTSNPMTNFHPCGEIDGRKDKTFVPGKVGTKFYGRTVAEERVVIQEPGYKQKYHKNSGYLMSEPRFEPGISR
jgi:hypothetical protein